MKITWRETAQRQLRRQIEHVRQRNSNAADRLERRIEACVAQLAEFPYLGRPSRRLGVRELVITGTPYIAVYSVVGDEIVILALLPRRAKSVGRLTKRG